MSISVRRFAELTPQTISAVQATLTHYYSQRRESYYEIADQAATQYSPAILPFHCHLVDRVKPGMTLLEVGCGTAHLCKFVQGHGGNYTGLDYNEELLEENRRRFPAAQFLKIGTDIRTTFDIVASLYTIEHIVDPPTYLEKMWTLCKPGGIFAIICPEMIDGSDLGEFPPSFYYGKTPRRFRDKIRSLSFFDAFQHLVDLLVHAPKWKRRALESDPGAFWINLRPRILAGAPYSIDADAVHLTRLKDLVWWLKHRGAAIERTSRDFPEIDPLILRYNCYVLARKPIG
jgi:SAM-dependent methyltransferase